MCRAAAALRRRARTARHRRRHRLRRHPRRHPRHLPRPERRRPDRPGRDRPDRRPPPHRCRGNHRPDVRRGPVPLRGGAHRRRRSGARLHREARPRRRAHQPNKRRDLRAGALGSGTHRPGSAGVGGARRLPGHGRRGHALRRGVGRLLDRHGHPRDLPAGQPRPARRSRRVNRRRGRLCGPGCQCRGLRGDGRSLDRGECPRGGLNRRKRRPGRRLVAGRRPVGAGRRGRRGRRRARRRRPQARGDQRGPAW